MIVSATQHVSATTIGANAYITHDSIIIGTAGDIYYAGLDSQLNLMSAAHTIGHTIGGILYATTASTTATATATLVFGSHITASTTGFIYTGNKKASLRTAIKSRLAPTVIRSNPLLDVVRTASEQKAQFLLREMLSEDEFFRYVRRGWVTRTGKSGKVYCIPVNGQVRVYDAGKHVENICVHVTNEVPPSDRIFTLLTILDLDEDLFRASGNIRPVSSGGRITISTGSDSLVVRPSLVEVARALSLGRAAA